VHLVLWPADLRHPGQLNRKHFLVQVENGRERLTMRGRRYASLVREKAQEGLDLGWPHVVGVAHVVKPDEEAHPVDVCLLGLEAVVRVAEAFMQPIQETNRFERWSIHD
jgi:hypothetical protein